MAVTTTASYSGPYLGNGATTVFPFTFTAPSAAEVEVRTIAGDGTETILAPGAYSTALVEGGGGTVTFATAPPSGVSIYIALDPIFTQEIAFEDGSAWLAGPVNEAADRSVARDQWLKREVERSFRIPLNPEPYAGLYPVVDASGEPSWSSGTGADAGLRTDLAASGGAALSGYRHSGTADTTTIETALRRFLHADDYGMGPAKTAAQNVAGWARIVALVGTNSATLGFGLGTYSFDAALALPDKLAVEGMGVGATILQFTAATDGLTRSSGFKRLDLKGFTIRSAHAGCGKALKAVNGSRGMVLDIEIDADDPSTHRWDCGVWLNNWQTTPFINVRMPYACRVGVHLEYGCNKSDFYQLEVIGYNGTERAVEMNQADSIAAAGNDSFETNFYGATWQGAFSKSVLHATGCKPIMIGGHPENTDAAPDDGADIVLGGGVVNAKFIGIQGGSFLTSGVVRNLSIADSEVGAITLATTCQGSILTGVRYQSFADADGITTRLGCSLSTGASEPAVISVGGSLGVRVGSDEWFNLSASGLNIAANAAATGGGQVRLGADSQATVGAAGGASALPGAPAGYLKFYRGATQYVLPYWPAA